MIKLVELLSLLEQKNELDEREVNACLKELLSSIEIDNNFLAESLAFMFYDNNQKTAWPGENISTYFKIANINYFNLTKVSSDIIDYWLDRANQTQHPVLKARYFGLVYDFYYWAKKEKCPLIIHHLLIDSIATMVAEKRHKFKNTAANRLKKALDISKSIRDAVREKRIKELILACEMECIDDVNNHNLWKISYDFLLIPKLLTPEEEKLVVERIFVRLEKTVNNITKMKRIGVDGLNEATKRLIQFYRNKPYEKENFKKIIDTYCEGVFNQCDISSSHLVAQNFLSRALELIKPTGFNDIVRRISLRLQYANQHVHEEMKHFSFSASIDSDAFEKTRNNIVGSDLEEGLSNLRLYLINLFKKEIILEELAIQKRNFPSVYEMQKVILSEDGRIIAENNSVNHLIGHYFLMMNSMKAIIRNFIEEIFKKYSPSAENIIDFLIKSPVFSEESSPFIKRGLEFYLNADPVIFIHILIPQIESIIRYLVDLNNGVIIKEKSGCSSLKTLGELLYNEDVIIILGEDITLWFRVVFTDENGFNLRNNVCHGILPITAFDMTKADLVFCSLLLLTFVQKTG